MCSFSLLPSSEHETLLYNYLPKEDLEDLSYIFSKFENIFILFLIYDLGHVVSLSIYCWTLFHGPKTLFCRALIQKRGQVVHFRIAFMSQLLLHAPTLYFVHIIIYAGSFRTRYIILNRPTFQKSNTGIQSISLLLWRKVRKQK